MISFFVEGKPITEGNIARGAGGHSYHRENRATATEPAGRLDRWRDAVAAGAREAGVRCEGKGAAVELNVVFYFERPKSHWSRGEEKYILPSAPHYYHTQRPDRDKLLRAIQDGLQGVAYADDSQVCDGNVEKVWCTAGQTPGVYIEVGRVD